MSMVFSTYDEEIESANVSNEGLISKIDKSGFKNRMEFLDYFYKINKKHLSKELVKSCNKENAYYRKKYKCELNEKGHYGLWDFIYEAENYGYTNCDKWLWNPFVWVLEFEVVK